MPYGDGLRLQEHFFSGLLVEKKDHPSRYTQANYLILLEHTPVFTLGKSGLPQNLLVSQGQLLAQGIDFYATSRGGDITYHGPGQLVVYPIFDLDQHFTDIDRYLRTLEEAVICTLADFGINAGRSAGQTGVWIGNKKICAMGIKASRWVVMHGIALNINTDLAYYSYIIPCNIPDKEVTSMEALLGYNPGIENVSQKLLLHISALFGLNLKQIPVPSLAKVPQA